VYYNIDQLENDLTALNYKKLERKPWNVRPTDVIVLEQYGMGFLNSGFMPAVVTLTDSYPEFNNPYPYDRKNVSRTTYRLYHKPLHPEADAYRFMNWPSTRWHSTDTVEIWRPTKN
jgi:hypothetical protein